MDGALFLNLTILVPVISGIFLLLQRRDCKREFIVHFSELVLCICGALMILTLVYAREEGILFQIGEGLVIRFYVDSMGCLFAGVVSVVWILGAFFASEYMKHEGEDKRYFGFYLCVYGVLMGLCFAGNMISYYFFYEMMTLLSLPLVFHSRTREAITAGIKYLLYSLFGAYLVLFGIYFLYRYCDTLNFIPGGSLNAEAITSSGNWILVVTMMMIMGFGVKAGLFPLHGWLPTAHPVAPAPASAVLSGIIVKMGVLGVIRTIYYVVGIDFLKGTWVQTVFIILSLITVFLGSLMAYQETVLKKRLAYSTVSQVSYILFGLAMMNAQACTGALLHVVFHAFIKSCLFFSAGAIIYKTGKTNVNDLRGIGKEMPVTIWCYTFVSLALIGIPPASGFISKWYLAIGSLQSAYPVLSWFGPVVLLLSALLTAGYLLPITINGFLPGNTYDYSALVNKEPVKAMVLPIYILACLAVILGIVPGLLTDYVTGITSLFF